MSGDTAARRALITGVTGQDGSYLAEQLLEEGWDVWGLVRPVARTGGTQRIDHLLDGRGGSGRLRLIAGDLTDSSSLHRAVGEVRPHEIYNLGAQSHVQVSFELPGATSEVTGLGVLRLLEAARRQAPEARFYQASSSEIYGLVEESPQSETTRFYPRSPYAAAKAYGFHITRNYREAYGLFAVNGILFNHESPRRGEDFVTRKITLAAARIRAGLQEGLELGNLESRRDWGFAGDYVEAMRLMLRAEDPEDYVIATGETHSVREFCEIAFARAGTPLTWRGEGVEEQGVAEDGRVLVTVDPRHFRKAEVPALRGDASLAWERLGWRPRVAFRQLVEMMVDADLEAVGCG
ncbi:MAG: GDP-mannose 4,6-dehydratase [Acidobacteriota bacterium]|nr:GDP-mannose 4,6-dehydratase [Acidobacteriota bacterium]MDE2923423.1 GDP-mannose 4,6-dehydratase [Acidobacteriota bacterium]MDE3263654.1 GDP-mannose 4,6-dehydratase [Acidobacteriota bacterium]